MPAGLELTGYPPDHPEKLNVGSQTAVSPGSAADGRSVRVHGETGAERELVGVGARSSGTGSSGMAGVSSPGRAGSGSSRVAGGSSGDGTGGRVAKAVGGFFFRQQAKPPRRKR